MCGMFQEKGRRGAGPSSQRRKTHPEPGLARVTPRATHPVLGAQRQAPAGLRPACQSSPQPRHQEPLSLNPCPHPCEVWRHLVSSRPKALGARRTGLSLGPLGNPFHLRRFTATAGKGGVRGAGGVPVGAERALTARYLSFLLRKMDR